MSYFPTLNHPHQCKYCRFAVKPKRSNIYNDLFCILKTRNVTQTARYNCCMSSLWFWFVFSKSSDLFHS